MSDNLAADLVVGCIADIDIDLLIERGIAGVIVDMDNTLAPWRSTEVPPSHIDWVHNAKSRGLKVCILSNAGSDGRVRPAAEMLGISFITKACKPLAVGFKRAARMMNLPIEKIAIAGDQVFTDIWGGNRLGMFTILTTPLSKREAVITLVLQRPLERLLGRRQK
ncbi:MAG: YqeG family HAD IIIA-type phosphatase [bacterium]